MGLFRSARDRLVLSRMQEEEIHAAALREVESGRRRDGLWAKALIEGSGERSRVESIYLRELVAAMRDESYIARRLDDFTDAAEKGTHSAPAVDTSSSPLPRDASFSECERYATSRGWTFRTAGLISQHYVVRTKEQKVTFRTFPDAVAWMRSH
jgi:hypothetical protein